MAIRDRFRRAVRKSASTGPTIKHTDTSLTTTSNTSNESESSSISPRRQSFFSRAFPWGTRRSTRSRPNDSSNEDNSDNNDEQRPQKIDLTLTRTASEAEREMKAEKKRQRKAKNKRAAIHPRDKPLTAQNLRHQAMLGTWTWDEAAGNPRHSFASGISPCCTRAPSIREAYDDGDDICGGDDYFDNGGSSHEVVSGPAITTGREF